MSKFRVKKKEDLEKIWQKVIKVNKTVKRIKKCIIIKESKESNISGKNVLRRKTYLLTLPLKALNYDHSLLDTSCFFLLLGSLKCSLPLSLITMYTLLSSTFPSYAASLPTPSNLPGQLLLTILAYKRSFIAQWLPSLYFQPSLLLCSNPTIQLSARLFHVHISKMKIAFLPNVFILFLLYSIDLVKGNFFLFHKLETYFFLIFFLIFYFLIFHFMSVTKFHQLYLLNILHFLHNHLCFHCFILFVFVLTF